MPGERGLRAPPGFPALAAGDAAHALYEERDDRHIRGPRTVPGKRQGHGLLEQIVGVCPGRDGGIVRRRLAQALPLKRREAADRVGYGGPVA
jgi:hypothetical protein